MKKTIIISTGGTGGHVIPATIIYEHLKADFEVLITTDSRGLKFLNFKKYNPIIFNTPNLKKNFIFFPIKLFKLFTLILKSLLFLKKKNVDTLVSTGGYMSLPLIISARILGLNIYLFEPNMVLGRSNKFFLKYCKKIFCYSNEIINFPEKYLKKIVIIDNLVRKEFYSIEKSKKTELKDEIKILIIGGSQGAKLFDTELRNALLNISKKYKLNVYHQINSTQNLDLENFYKQNNIVHNLFNFKENILKLIINIDLCITRAGASTLSELFFLNIPFLAIPYPLAVDDHQFQNALFYKKKNCCWVLKEDEIKHNVLSDFLINIIQNKNDYILKKENMKKFSYQNSWNKINEKLVGTINEN